MGARHGSGDRPRIFGTGLIALDLVISSDPTQPVRSWAGGTCGNVLAILSFLGWDAYPIARLNDDAASLKVKADLRRWGVHLDHAESTPASDTPIIIQEIRRDKNGTPKHRFSWACPRCGTWLPGFKPVTLHQVDRIADRMISPRVFFMDRLSRASLALASKAAQRGAIVVFEPSARADGRLLEEALRLSHVVKYAAQRVGGLGALDRPSPSVLLEIQTLGAEGLRYRSWLSQARTESWQHLPALPGPVLADTCGAGDWCTAGVIAKLGADGYDGLERVDPCELRKALLYGQALAAWNCGFEGARGGMYRVEQRDFEQQVRQILDGKVENLARPPQLTDDASIAVSCPACPPGQRSIFSNWPPQISPGAGG